MKIGIPKEIISQEYRVSINPETAKMLLQSSHELFVQSGAGIDSGYQMKTTQLWLYNCRNCF